MKKLQNNAWGFNEFKLRIGDYRVIADIKEKTKNISIHIIDHRKNRLSFYLFIRMNEFSLILVRFQIYIQG